MSVYLHDIPLSQAQNQLDQILKEAGLDQRLGVETLLLTRNILGRVLAEPVWALMSSPHYHASAMDGFAVQAVETNGALPTSPITLSVSGQAQYIDTGDPLPEKFNAVIPIENVESLSKDGQIAENPRQPSLIRIRAAVPPWQHVRPMGEDIVATQLVLPSGHTLRPVDLGAIAACGHIEVALARKPRVAILPTGTELTEIGQQPIRVGDIIEYNSLVLAAQVQEWGGEVTRFPITPDDLKLLKKRVQNAAEDHDLILLNAGSSAGSEDFSAQVVEELGKLFVHGVAIRPGHPVILGLVHKKDTGKVPIIGVPGYPVSSALTGEIFVNPLISRWLGRNAAVPEIIEAELTQKLTSPPGDDDFIRVAVGRVKDKILAAPLSRGAGVITSLVRADGLALIPSGSQGEPAGAKVPVQLYVSRGQINKTIFSIGSHDLTLDLLAQFLAQHGRRFVSANAGSLGGLIALGREVAHLAGSHLLDTDTGEFNLSYVKKYLPEIPVKILGFVKREQGLIIPKGNPKRLKIFSDLARPDIQFINRQRGAGTRILLDYNLKLLDIDTEQIQGYHDEEYTHLNVASAVKSGRADCSLGIAAAAAALDLDFIPLFEERYDLIIPIEHAESSLLSPIWTVLDDPKFRKAIEDLPGYDTEPLGKLIATVG